MADTGGVSGAGSSGSTSGSQSSDSSGASTGSSTENSATGSAASVSGSTGGKGAASTSDSNTADNNANSHNSDNNNPSTDSAAQAKSGVSAAASATTAQSIAMSSTTADSLATAPTTADSLASSSNALDGLMEDANFDKSVYSNEDKSVNVGRAKGDYTAPNTDLDTEKSKASASVGLSGELTLADAKGDVAIGDLAQVDGKVTVGTVNAHATLEAKGEFKGLKSSATLKGSIGAEAMAVDAKVAAELSITPKTVGDTLGGLYNSYVDPVVDYVAGTDVPGIPEVPDSWDHGVVVGGYVEGGYGVAGKAHAGLELGNGKGLRGSAGLKGNIAPGVVVGAGATFGLK